MTTNTAQTPHSTPRRRCRNCDTLWPEDTFPTGGDLCAFCLEARLIAVTNGATLAPPRHPVTGARLSPVSPAPAHPTQRRAKKADMQ